ncbi:MBL fold metallo-hydrolase [Gemella cuniculi]|uniref:MBL fold metallo-hydrolase n=1 Tax=Gemella cuniculi TaxID=150240 RepID=UPI000403E299|nr:MBL fold metallo-hydrolase [Gemella cuniculi]
MLIKFSNKLFYTKQRYMYLEPAVGYVKGKNFSVMIDSGNGPEQVESFLKDLKENNLPHPSYVILTHHHWDHSFGSAYLNIPVISTEKAKNALIEFAHLKWDNESIEQRVEDGVEIQYSADVLKKVYRNHEIKIKIPDISKSGDITLNLGEEKVICFCNDNSHSDDAFIVYVVDEKVLFLGDSHAKNYYTKPMSYDKTKLRDYIDTIKKIDFEYAIPGHGNIFTRNDLLAYLEKEYTKMR